MKRIVFLIDKSRKEDAEGLLNRAGITFSYNDRFYFDVRTAVVTAIAVIIAIIVIF